MHALVVGGTGMLRNASVALADSGQTVSVIARRPEQFGSTKRIIPLGLDYQDEQKLTAALRATIKENGPIELAVCWIHNTAPTALTTVAKELACTGRPFRLFHVQGSRAADPALSAPPKLQEIPHGCLYRQVLLGFIVEGSGSRWLTNLEISAGVLHAIKTDDPLTIVGTVRPWHMRPE